MSYDLHVIAKRQPKASVLETFLAAVAGTPKADGRLKAGGHLLVTDASAICVEIDGPSRIEAEDVPDAANGAIGAFGWLVQLSVKPSTDAA